MSRLSDAQKMAAADPKRCKQRGDQILINVSHLLCRTENYGDTLRYKRGVQGAQSGTTRTRGPVVVWNCTKACNLRCIHCYSNSDNNKHPDELTTGEGKALIDDLARMRVPVLLLSGGEPLLRPDLTTLISHAVKQGIRVTISTNGTLITEDLAQTLKELGVSYVGVSLDGIGANNDEFRGKKGAFDAALQGIRRCQAAGQKVGLRFTMNSYNIADLDEIFQLVEAEDIPRVCFYHLAYSGRGSEMISADISHAQTRNAVEQIASQAETYAERGLQKEILTVDNHCDGMFLYLRETKQNPDKAAEILELLKINGGNRSGIAIGCVDWLGQVHPDQFSQDITLGSVRERSFDTIWTDESHSVLRGLRNRKPLLKGRCGGCPWLHTCNGNFRPRAAAVTGDYWEADPACYLTDEEIAAGKYTQGGAAQ